MKLVCTRGADYEYRDPATGKQYFSVSQVLKVMDPDAFAGIDPYVMAAAQQRGTDLHTLFALTLLARQGLCEMPVRPTGIIGGYYGGIEKFMRERNPIPIRVEEPSINDQLQIAGTLDTECWLDKDDSIVDIKTGLERGVHSPQLHAYRRLKGHEKAKRLYSLYITKKGDYKLVEHTRDTVDWGGFMAALSVLQWRRLRG